MLAMAALNFAYSAELVQGYSASRPESYKITFFSLATKAANKTTCKTGFSQKTKSKDLADIVLVFVSANTPQWHTVFYFIKAALTLASSPQ